MLDARLERLSEHVAATNGFMNTVPRFGHAREAYAAYRPGYPDFLFEKILAAIPEDRRERAVDLGAGTGKSTLPLCRWFREVIAVESDPQMAAAIRELNEEIEIRIARAEELEQAAESVDLVTSAIAFYWMDGPRVIENVTRWLRPGGVFAVYRYDIPTFPAGVQAIADREMKEHWDVYRHERLRDTDYSRRTLIASERFPDVEIERFSSVQRVTVSEMVGFLRSTSFGTAYMRTLADPDDYLIRLEEETRRAALVEPFEMHLTFELILARKSETKI